MSLQKFLNRLYFFKSQTYFIFHICIYDDPQIITQSSKYYFMKHISSLMTGFLIFFSISVLQAQKTEKIDRVDFFKDERPIEMKISTDIKALLAEKKEGNYVKASVAFKMPDRELIREIIQVRPRGIFRKQNCNLASLMLEFRNEEISQLSSLKKLKMVGGCSKSSGDEQLVLKEYLVYKIYNLFTEMSLNVRLVKTDYNDSRGKMKDYTQYAFLIEDIDDMAKRNGCMEKENSQYHPERTNREHTTLVSVFQYMIGNTDWSIPYYHNIKLLVPKNDTNSFPYAVPYDFDVTGFVNAYYASPPPELGISSVTERVYRGFPRTIEEIEETVKNFIQKKDQIYSMINEFELLSNSSKKEMLNFLDDFYFLVNNKKNLQRIFIDNARSG
jgi:hypothetical protein